MSDRTSAYIIWQGRVSTEKIPACDARLVNVLRKTDTIVCEILDKDHLGAPMWRPAPQALPVVMEFALIAMHTQLTKDDVLDLPHVGGYSGEA